MGGDDKKILCVCVVQYCTVLCMYAILWTQKVAYWMMTWKGGIGIEH